MSRFRNSIWPPEEWPASDQLLYPVVTNMIDYVPLIAFLTGVVLGLCYRLNIFISVLVAWVLTSAEESYLGLLCRLAQVNVVRFVNHDDNSRDDGKCRKDGRKVQLQALLVELHSDEFEESVEGC